MSESRDDPKITALNDRQDSALSALYRQAPQDEPPSALDNRILKAAHDAAHAPARRTRPHWLPLASGVAASLFVAVLVVQLLPHSTQEIHDAVTPEKKRAEAPTLQQLSEPEQQPQATQTDADRPAAPAPVPERMAQAFESLDRNKNELGAQKAIAGRADDGAVQSRLKPLAEEAAGVAAVQALSPADVERDQSRQAVADFRAILHLWHYGDTVTALERYRDFRRRYPDFVADDKDQALLKELDAGLERETPALKTPAQTRDDMPPR